MSRSVPDQPDALTAAPQVLACLKTHTRVEAIFRELPHDENTTVLDLGAGEGPFSRTLQDLGYQVEAADLFPENFKIPGVPCHRVHFDRRFPLEDARYDHVVSIEVIEHLKDQYSYAREVNRILKPGGCFVVTTPNILNLASRLKYLLTGFYSLVVRPINEFEGSKLYDHIAPTTYYQVRYILHTNGFRIRRVTTDRYRHSNVFLIWLWPLVKWLTAATVRKETDPRQIEANREILRHMTGLDLLMGRTLIVLAEKVGQPQSAHPGDDPG